MYMHVCKLTFVATQLNVGILYCCRNAQSIYISSYSLQGAVPTFTKSILVSLNLKVATPTDPPIIYCVYAQMHTYNTSA